MVLGAGISHLDFNDDFPLQSALLNAQIHLESTFTLLAQAYHSQLPNMEYIDPDLAVIEKRRKCFVYEGQYFELDEFQGWHKGLMLLEVELASPGQVVYLPPWIEIEHEVTGRDEWSNRALAGSARACPTGWRNTAE